MLLEHGKPGEKYNFGGDSERSNLSVVELEADCAVGSLDDFNVEIRKNFPHGVGELRSLISAVSEEFVQQRKRPKQRRHDENATIAVLDVGRMNDGVEQEA